MSLPRSISDWPQEWRELYEERAGIMEFVGNMSHYRAEAMAEDDTRKTYAQQETKCNSI